MTQDPQSQIHVQSHESLALVPVTFDAESLKVLRSMYPKMTDEDQQFFVMTCNRLLLDPFAKQLHAVWRYDSIEKREKMAIQVGIDGFRLQAERSGKYEGQRGPEWCGMDGVWHDVWLSDKPPAAARVGVWRRGARELLWGTATWREYAQKNRDGQPNRMWAAMPAIMLAKVAESIALRKAFPYELSGLYTEDEMAQADNAFVEHQPGPNVSVPPGFSGSIEDTTTAPAQGQVRIETVQDPSIRTGSSDVLSSEVANEEPPSRDEQNARWAGANKLVAVGTGEKVSLDSDPDMKRFLEIQEIAAGVEMKVSVPVLPIKRSMLVQMSEALLKTVNKKLAELGKEPFFPRDPEAPPTVIDAEQEPEPELAPATAPGEEIPEGDRATAEQLGVIKRLSEEKGVAEIQVGVHMYAIDEILEAGCAKEVATMVMGALQELPAVPQEEEATGA